MEANIILRKGSSIDKKAIIDAIDLLCLYSIWNEGFGIKIHFSNMYYKIDSYRAIAAMEDTRLIYFADPIFSRVGRELSTRFVEEGVTDKIVVFTIQGSSGRVIFRNGKINYANGH